MVTYLWGLREFFFSTQFETFPKKFNHQQVSQDLVLFKNAKSFFYLTCLLILAGWSTYLTGPGRWNPWPGASWPGGTRCPAASACSPTCTGPARPSTPHPRPACGPTRPRPAVACPPPTSPSGTTIGPPPPPPRPFRSPGGEASPPPPTLCRRPQRATVPPWPSPCRSRQNPTPPSFCLTHRRLSLQSAVAGSSAADRRWPCRSIPSPRPSPAATSSWQQRGPSPPPSVIRRPPWWCCDNSASAAACRFSPRRPTAKRWTRGDGAGVEGVEERWASGPCLTRRLTSRRRRRFCRRGCCLCRRPYSIGRRPFYNRTFACTLDCWRFFLVVMPLISVRSMYWLHLFLFSLNFFCSYFFKKWRL